MPIRRPALLSTAVVVAAFLSGCSATPAGPDESVAPSAAPSSSVVAPQAGGVAEAGIDPSNPPEAIARTTLPINGQNGIDSTLVEIVGMRHTESVLIVTFRFTADGAASSSEEASIFEALGSQSLFPYLIDYENLKRYGAVPGLLSDITAIRAPLGEPMYAQAAFAYPENAETVDVLINTSTPAIEKVPVPE